MNERELSIIRALGEEFAAVITDLQRTFEEKMAAQAQQSLSLIHISEPTRPY